MLGVAVLVSDVTDGAAADEALRRSVERTEQLQRATAALAEALTDRRRTPGSGRDRTRRHRCRGLADLILARRAAWPCHATAGPRVQVDLAVSGGRIGSLLLRVRRPGGRPGRRLPRRAGRAVRDRAGAGPAVRAGAGDRGRPCSAACCRTGCRTSPASSWRPGSAPARPRPRSAGTGTTCSACPTAGW